MMRNKIQYNFDELPVTSYESLKDSLLNHLSKKWPLIVVTQLALAISDLALVMSQWRNPIADIFDRLAPSNPTDTATQIILFEILTVFPEEVVKNTRLKLGQNRREEVKQSLRASASRVIETMTSVLQGVNDDRTHCQVFRALESWLAADALPPNDRILLTIMLPMGFDLLANTQTSEALHSTVSQALSKAIFLAEESRKHPDLAWLCANRVFQLHDTYLRLVSEEDPARTTNIVHLFTDLAESLTEDFITTPGQGLGDFRTIELILLCMQHYDYEIAELTFDFWYKFSAALYKLDNSDMQEVYKPYVMRLIAALCHHCQLEADREGLPDKDDEFTAFRERCNDMVDEVAFIVGSRDAFRMLTERLSQMSAQGPPWNVTEATLFTMTALGPKLVPEESELIPPVLDAVLALPDKCHVAVRYTGIRLLGKLAEWLSHHPQYLWTDNHSVLSLVVNSLNTPVVAAGAYTLQQVCTFCREHLRPHASNLGDLVISVQQQLGPSGVLSTEAISGLLQGATHVLAEAGDSTRLLALLEVQLRPIDDMLLNPNHQILHRNHISDPVLWADRVAVLFRELSELRPHKSSTGGSLSSNQAQPITSKSQDNPSEVSAASDKGGNPEYLLLSLDDSLALAQRAWHSLDGTLQRWTADTRIVERVSRTIKYMVRFLSTAASPLVDPLVNRLVSTYKIHPHSCFLYLASILVDEFGRMPSCVPGLISLVNTLAETTFQTLNSAEALEQNPDTIEDFFRLCTRCVQRAPLALMSSSCFRGILEYSLACLSYERRDAHAAVLRFLGELLSCTRDNDKTVDSALRTNTVNIFNEMGARFVYGLVEAAILKLPLYLSHDFAEILYDISRLVDRPKYLEWLEAAARSLPVVGVGGTVTVTPAQLDTFLHSARAANTIRELANALKVLGRLYV
ncbi:transportin-3-like isoform X2 [Varroa jacobsoni]|nr:transportin-3-like isoform X2 [Varroa destructor]XP_022700993.1 transportin-3-like isoform X2 [Varroa jacobsoni]